MDRRHFLAQTGRILISPYAIQGLAGLVGTNALAAQSEAAKNHLLLVIRVWGGMDCTVGLNPWTEPRQPDPRDLFLDDKFKFLRVKNTNITLGPSAVSLAPFARNLAVINGVFMGTTDLGHPFAQNYITTAKSSPGTPHFVTELAEDRRRLAKTPQETVLFSGQLQSFDLEHINKLHLDLLTPSNSGNSGRGDSEIEFPTLNPTGRQAIAEAFRTAAQVEAQRRGVEQYFERLKKKSEPSTQGAGEFSKAQELIDDCTLVAALAGGAARFAQVDWEYSGLLDTHTEFTNRHQRGQRHVWERVASIMKMLSSLEHPRTRKALFPHHVTLAVLTEFSRTPFLNANQGKDHNYFDNSILLGGRGIVGGQTIGAHALFKRNPQRLESQLSGCHIDFKSGEVVTNEDFSSRDLNRVREQNSVSLIRPENILRSLGHVFGVDQRNMRLFGKDTLPLPKILG